MAKKKEIVSIDSTGICKFCEGEFDKDTVTQHLKSCQPRKAWIKAANSTESEKKRQFHLFVEGTQHPKYWMHLEVPADLALADLDDFLRAIWVECCGHLSSFEIGGTSYCSEPDDFYFGEIPNKEEAGEEIVAEDVMEGVVDIEKLPEVFSTESLEILPSGLLSEIRKERTVDELVIFLKETITPMRKLRRISTQEGWEQYQEVLRQKSVLEEILVMIEDRSLGVRLEKVLKVGRKFSYEYDFGSTTHLTLKVMTAREGAVAKDEDGAPVEFLVMARNNPPVIPCRTCGKPATGIVAGYYSIEDGAVCDDCAKNDRREYEDGSFLPIVNSPRVGVCGYCGDEEGDWSEMYEDEEDEEE